MVRKGLSMLLAAYPDIEVVGEAEEGNEAVLLAQTLHPDVILMDLSMPNGLDGFLAGKKIHGLLPEIGIIALTMHDEEVFIQQAIKIGARGYILKNSQSDVLVSAIYEVHKGRPYFRTSVSEEKIKQWLETKEDEPLPSVLTDREKEIVRLTVLGFTNKQIADKLMISNKTVENHKTNIMTKLKFTTKHDLIQFAIRNGYFDIVVEK
ncbi:response regulator [Tumebacillus flagellatus]|nr:response regulator transcription factor [Tumebacillus flagellatus]